jgi:fermentation-respiration switch protein FrsA (DUF1100 family)
MATSGFGGPKSAGWSGMSGSLFFAGVSLAIRDADVPVMVLHGEADQIIPISSARALLALAKEPKEIVAVAGAGHLVLNLPQVFPHVAAFINAASAPRQ